jgi:hypothetical protein
MEALACTFDTPVCSAIASIISDFFTAFPLKNAHWAKKTYSAAILNRSLTVMQHGCGGFAERRRAAGARFESGATFTGNPCLNAYPFKKPLPTSLEPS